MPIEKSNSPAPSQRIPDSETKEDNNKTNIYGNKEGEVMFRSSPLSSLSLPKLRVNASFGGKEKKKENGKKGGKHL